jgi:hypothetical protein
VKLKIIPLCRIEAGFAHRDEAFVVFRLAPKPSFLALLTASRGAFRVGFAKLDVSDATFGAPDVEKPFYFH